MKKLIRSKGTRVFLARDGQWTKNLEEALDCSNVQEAIAIKSKLKLEDVELYYSFHEEEAPQYDFFRPLL